VVQTEPVARRAPTPPPVRRVSILPAAAVLGLAVVTLVLFGLLNLVASPRTTTTTLPVVLGGIPIEKTAIFRSWTEPGLVPANIASALVLPRGARLLSTVGVGGGEDGFDHEDRLVIVAPRARLLGFYRAHFVGLGWALISTSGTSGGGDELLFQKGGTDGFYWEAGVNATEPSTITTPFTLRLFQVADFS
jgi:hypothetical protein